MKPESIVTVKELDRFEEILDVRSPAEFAEDHVPGAVSCPVLDDEERARIGTIYAQQSPFQAKKLGAALVSRNIARHIEERFLARGRDWRPLLYCWRGGQRSSAFAHVLRQIGWHVATLEGGYRAYRRAVLAQLDELPASCAFKVICGATGSGKSRLLEALHAQGAQVLDLEALARHRGSVLGDLPQEAQPSQKMFDTLVWDRLRRFDPARPVFVEAESRRIGLVQVHPGLLERMRGGECLVIEVPVAERVGFLMDQYRHFLDDPEGLKAKLSGLKELYGHEVIERWLAQADARAWHALVPDLLKNHYDPAYLRSTVKNFRQYHKAEPVRLDRLDAASLQRAAKELTGNREPAVAPHG
ncbi:MAG: tRNA 2-selenouridine(34) synthase MnmH [Betaproteobacteria bacterium RIFCSPLOWO2_12_FULL_66_14]|nr:MAG: tRNA 2-selenouridine(34) synthase MnmH [Betaproteobacteria bacterium RIFCSPLOWO2_12_FULL_66_14]